MKIATTLKDKALLIGAAIIAFLLFLVGKKNNKIGDLQAKQKYQKFQNQIDVAREAKIEAEFQHKKANKEYLKWRKQHEALYGKLDGGVAPKRLK